MTATEGAAPVVTTVIKSASLDNFCQSAIARSLPFVGDVSLVIRATGGDSVQGSNLVINISNLTGKIFFENPELGIDASQLTKGPSDVVGSLGSFGQQADRFVLDKLQATALRTTASTLTLNGAALAVSAGRSECF